MSWHLCRWYFLIEKLWGSPPSNKRCCPLLYIPSVLSTGTKQHQDQPTHFATEE
jgi:hypothetical protein